MKLLRKDSNEEETQKGRIDPVLRREPRSSPQRRVLHGQYCTITTAPEHA